MGFQVSPGVVYTEKDATGIISAASTTDGAYAGPFYWGPLEQVTLVGSEGELAEKFGSPKKQGEEGNLEDTAVAISFFSCANFLAYGDKLRVVRTLDTTSKADRTLTIESIDRTNNKITFTKSVDALVDASTGAKLPAVERLDEIQHGIADVEALIVLEVEKSAPTTISGTFTTDSSVASGTLIVSSTTAFRSVLYAGAVVVSGGEERVVVSVSSAPTDGSTDTKSFVISQAFTSALSGVSLSHGGNRTVEVRPTTPIPASLSLGNTVTAKVHTGARNATTDKKGALIKNDDDYARNYADGQANVGAFVAKFPGKLGDSLRVSVCPSSAAYKTTLTGTFSTSKSSDADFATYGTEWLRLDAGQTSNFASVLAIGSIIRNPNTGEERSVVNLVDTSIKAIKLDSPFEKALVTASIVAKWEFSALCTAPGTSAGAKDKAALNDELHIVIVDENGEFTGTPGFVLERFLGVSKASNARTSDGGSNYYKDVINRKSKYVRWCDHVVEAPDGEVAWGTLFQRSKSFYSPAAPLSLDLAGGVNGAVGDEAENARTLRGYYLFKDADKVDVSLVFMGEAALRTIIDVHDNVVQKRLDCVLFISPPRAAVVDNKGNEAAEVVNFRNDLNISSSYVVMDSGWKKQFDKYNDIAEGIWIPLNADVAGLCVRTDVQQDPWWSPAGYTRGQIKNTLKLAWSPYKAERDDLYLHQVNPVIDQPGEGRILFGDKTMLTKASAFDRINVRRLFIVLEKFISRQAKYFLFEFNDEFTRQQFRSMVEPFLRDVQSRRGLYDFKVVCDKTNNTPEIIDRNEFVGDIYIKPARSINFIQLNFIAVRTGVEFSEIVGKI
jgi:Phage tail sheath protein subtilisin-like domain/Phage tail sheath C-terminal domain